MMNVVKLIKKKKKIIKSFFETFELQLRVVGEKTFVTNTTQFQLLNLGLSLASIARSLNTIVTNVI